MFLFVRRGRPTEKPVSDFAASELGQRIVVDNCPHVLVRAIEIEFIARVHAHKRHPAGGKQEIARPANLIRLDSGGLSLSESADEEIIPKAGFTCEPIILAKTAREQSLNYGLIIPIPGEPLIIEFLLGGWSPTSGDG